MTPIIDKALMTEEDIKLNYITPPSSKRAGRTGSPWRPR